jgi:hypothetical protein
MHAGMTFSTTQQDTILGDGELAVTLQLALVRA